MNRKLIFLDVDGTFTAPGGYIPPESAVRAVKRARELGHKVFLCSGRNYGMLEPLHKYGFDGGIASCGGYIYAGDKVIYDCPLTEDQKEKVISLLSGAVQAGGIPVNLSHACGHCIQSRTTHLCCGGIVSINFHKFLIVPSINYNFT